MKRMILAGAALLVGVAAGTGWSVVNHEPTPVGADSLASHEAPHDGEAAGGTAVAGEAVAEIARDSARGGLAGTVDDSTESDSLATRVDPPAQQGAPPFAASQDPLLTVPGEPATAAGGPVAAGPVVPSTEDEPQVGDAGADQLARIFSSMQARDAARVLARMEDDAVRAILTRMGARQAAAVLTNMEPERAAGLSRSVLESGGTP